MRSNREPCLLAAGLLAVAAWSPVSPARADSDEVAQALKKARAAQARGDFDGAIGLYRNIDRLTADDTDRRRANLLNEIGELYRTVGLYQDAEQSYQQSQKMYATLFSPEHEFVAVVVHNLGLLYAAVGRYPAAQEAYEKGIAILGKKFGVNDPKVAWCQSDLAELYRLTGRYGEAEQLCQASLAVLVNGGAGFRLQQARARNSLGALYEQLGRYDDAEKALQEALALYQQLGDPDLGKCEANLGWLYFARGADGDLRLAEKHFQNSLTILREKFGPDHPSVARTQSNLGWLYHTQGRYADAEPLYRSSLKTRTAKLPADHPELALSRYNLALLLGSEGKWDEAAAEMDRARQALGRHLNHTLPFLAESEQLAFLKTQQEQLYATLSLGFARRDDPHLAELSAEWLLNGKAIAHQVLAERTLLARDSGDSRVKELAAVRSQIATMTLVNAAPDELQRLKERERDLSQEIGQATGNQVGGRPWVTLDAVRARLPANAVLIEIAKFDTWDFKARQKQRPGQALRYAAWIMPARGEGRVQVVDLGDAGPIEQAVDAVRAAVDGYPRLSRTLRERELEEQLQEPLGQLAQRIYKPLQEFISRKERWIVSPDGKLWLASWAMLPVAARTYAVEEHAISYVVSGRDLAHGRSTVKPSQSLVLANPDFDLLPDAAQAEAKQLLGSRRTLPTLRGGTRSFADLHKFLSLPGTKADADAAAQGVARITGEDPDKIELLGKQALEPVFKAARSPRFVVLSTHGWVLDQPKGPSVNPLLLCGLALAGANKRDEAKEGEDDGILTGLEITGTDLRGTELVILSACESGLGAVRDGEGVAGLRQAFELAGAETVVATLWEIPDDITPLLISGYFDGLVKGAGKADALRQAQRSLIEYRRKEVGAAHPFFWAAFTTTGRPD
jgi:CHAT domain-containing protein/Flp pilus assembly protein TadD